MYAGRSPIGFARGSERMMELISDWEHVEKELGHSLRENFLMPVRTLDNPKVFSPMILKSAGRRWGVFDDVEGGNVESLDLPEDLGVVYKRWYFTFDDLGHEPVARNLAEAIQRVGGGEQEITVDATLPVALHDLLAEHFRLHVVGGVDGAAVEVTAVPRGWVSERLRAGRAEAGPVVLERLLDRSPVRREIAPYLQDLPADRHFSSLDTILEESGLSGVVVSSRINVQETAGVPLASEKRPLAVVYPAGGASTFVIEPAGAGAGKHYPSLKAALDALAPSGVIGVEAQDLEVGLFRSLGLSARQTAPADFALRKWRDENALLDLGYYVIAGRSSAFANEKALAFAAAALEEGRSFTELDVDRVYFDGLQEHVRKGELPIRVTRMMTNLHCGSRTLRPANPVAFPVDAGVKTLKVDAGCMLFDEAGYLLACSDIARTLNLTEAGRELYALLVEGVKRTLIPAARAGALAPEIYDKGLDAVWNRRGELASNELTPDLPSLGAIYARDVGHLLGKNDLAHMQFIAGDKGRLKEGMVACLEYQWPINGHAPAYEDACLVTPGGGLNFTSDTE